MFKIIYFFKYAQIIMIKFTGFFKKNLFCFIFA